MANRPYKNVKRFAEDISKEIGTGGSSYPGAIQVSLLPELKDAVDGTVYQLPNGDVYKAHIKTYDKLEVGLYVTYKETITEAELNAFISKLTDVDGVVINDIDDPDDSSNTNLTSIEIVKTGLVPPSTYELVPPFVKFNGYGENDYRPSFAFDSTLAVKSDGFSDEDEFHITSYMKEGIENNSPYTLEDFTIFFNLPTDRYYELVEQNSVVKVTLDELPVPASPEALLNTVYEVKESKGNALITRAEDGNRLDFTSNAMGVYDTYEEAEEQGTSLMNGSYCYVVATNKLYTVGSGRLTEIGTPMTIEGTVIKGIFAVKNRNVAVVKKVISREVAPVENVGYIYTVETLANGNISYTHQGVNDIYDYFYSEEEIFETHHVVLDTTQEELNWFELD